MGLNLIMTNFVELYLFSKDYLKINVCILNFFPFTDVHYKIGEIFDDWRRELFSED